LDATINSLVIHRIELSTLVGQINLATSLELTEDLLLLYMADRQASGFLLDLKEVDGALPRGQVRSVAPAGFGQSETGIWFSTPTEGTVKMYWYVNGGLKTTTTNDLTTNRGITKAELGCVAGDVIQACIVVDGIIGWWGRVVVE